MLDKVADKVRDKAPQARDAGRSQVNLNTNALHEVYLEAQQQSDDCGRSQAHLNVNKLRGVPSEVAQLEVLGPASPNPAHLIRIER
jgi:hypothetical protein